MPPIHISIPGGQQAVYNDAQIRDLWQRGLLTATALYWMDGMPEWRPLVEYFHNNQGAFAPQAAPVPVPVRVTPVQVNVEPRYAFVKDPTSLTRFLKLMLWMYVVSAIVAIISDFAQLRLAQGGAIAPEAAAANDARQGFVAIGSIAIAIVTGIAFLKWIYRANINASGFGAKGMQFSPGWSIGCYFVPFVNLVRPFQAMKEIWQVSENPRNWKVVEVSGLLHWWWTCWLLSNLLGQLSFRLSLRVTDASSLETSTIAAIVAEVFDIPRCLVAMAVVTTIYRKQKALTQA